MLTSALQTLIAAGEFLTLELKKSTAEKGRACRSLCAPCGLVRFKGTIRDEFLDNRQYSGNAFAPMRRAERFLIDWLPVAGKIVPGQMA